MPSGKELLREELQERWQNAVSALNRHVAQVAKLRMAVALWHELGEEKLALAADGELGRVRQAEAAAMTEIELMRRAQTALENLPEPD